MSAEIYKVEQVSGPEADALIQRFLRSLGPENRSGRRSMVLPGGFEVKGEFSLTARDAQSGEIAWQHAEKNIITDYGRRQWMETHWHQAKIVFAPSTETPQSNRFTIGTDGSQCVETVAITPSNATATHTKTFTLITPLSAPGTNRTLGTIALARFTGSVSSALAGIDLLLSYALLTPPKTQTTTQTLEVVYKVSMNPIV
jgi:hypothetical protein